MKIQDNIHELCGRHLAGELSPKEEREFFEMLENREDAQDIFYEVSSVWNAPIKGAQLSKESIWNEIQNNFETKENRTIFAKMPFLLKVAAAFIPLIIATFWVINSSNQDPISYNTVAEQQNEIILPDGSKVVINENSTIDYQKQGKYRMVQFSGEGVFDVVHDTKHPFVIKTQNSEIEVVGTSFNVRSYQEEDFVEVTVLEGKVRFGAQELVEKPLLTKNQVGILKTNDVIVEVDSVQSDLSIAWFTQTLNFDDASLFEVLQSLERVYEASFNVGNTDIYTCTFNADVSDLSLDEIMKALELALGLEYTSEGDLITLKGEGCK